jgi:Lipocalin-like domain
MKRLSVLSLSAMAVALASLPGSTVAQQKSLKEQLVGAWALVSCEVPINVIRQPFCVNPRGSLILDASGRYTQVISARDRPNATPGPNGLFNRADVKPEEYKAMAQGVVANFGTWSVNEADKTLTTHEEGALFPNGEGGEGNEHSASPAMN